MLAYRNQGILGDIGVFEGNKMCDRVAYNVVNLSKHFTIGLCV